MATGTFMKAGTTTSTASGRGARSELVVSSQTSIPPPVDPYE
jgi:hypothetical protein